MNKVRPPAVAGLFYPAAERELSANVQAMLAVAASAGSTVRAPKAIIAPHAGYIYSGAIAATAYARLQALSKIITRVVLLGPTHRVAVRGLALPGAMMLATPLGSVAVDGDAVARLRQLPQVLESPAAHAAEHALEVHLPFLQTVLEHFTVVPLAVGNATPQEVAQVLDILWGGNETLIVVSSDLSHYLPYEQALAVDRGTVRSILDLRTDITHTQACGGTPVNGLLLAARTRGLTPELLDLRNSGDTAGDRQRVVGYGAFAFYESLHVH